MLFPFDFPASAVEADTSVIFCLDQDLRITYWNPAWDRFALENGGQKLCRPATIGRSVLDFITGPERDYYERHYRRTYEQSEPWEHDYECSSPNNFRQFRLRVIPLQKSRGLLVMNSLRVERAHQLPALPPVEEVYRAPHGLIVMCASCRRTRRNVPGADIWDLVPSFVGNMPLIVTHGFCTPCLEQYYADDL